MQRYEIVNGATEVEEGAVKETAPDNEEDQGNNYKYMIC